MLTAGGCLICHGLIFEWADLLRDFDRLPEATIAKDGKARASRAERIRTRIFRKWPFKRRNAVAIDKLTRCVPKSEAQAPDLS